MMYGHDDSNYNYIKDRISHKLQKLFQPTSRLDRFISRMIQHIMDKEVVPYFLDVVTRHTEEEFHWKMAQGFDILDDMKINHPKTYWAFMGFARKFGNRLNFNHEIIFETILDIIESPPYYWKITHEERLLLWNMTLKLRDEIYS